VPALPADLASVTTKTEAHLDAMGRLTGTTTTTAAGPYSIVLRAMAVKIQQVGPERAASALIAQTGRLGTGSFDPSFPTVTSAVFSLTDHFAFDPVPATLTGATFPMPGGLRVLTLSGDGPMGPFKPGKLKDDEPIPCYSAHAYEVLTLEPPPGRHFGTLPNDATIKTPTITFTAHWSFQGATIMVERDFRSTIDQAICSGPVHAENAEALHRIDESYSALISLAPPS